jgi:hypothetical protein
MKKILPLAFLVLMTLIVLHRQRVFVRDPLATLYRNGAKQPGTQIYINYSNDVLLLRDDPGGPHYTLIQHWNQMPGTPVLLRCVRSMACLSDADQAPTFPIVWTGKGRYDPHVSMSNAEVAYVAADGSRMQVELR